MRTYEQRHNGQRIGKKTIDNNIKGQHQQNIEKANRKWNNIYVSVR